MVVAEVLPDSPADRAGLARGDELIAIAAAHAELGQAASQVPSLVLSGYLETALGPRVPGITRHFRVNRAGREAPEDLVLTKARYPVEWVPRAEAPLVLFTEEHGWRCAACTPVDPREALPEGTRAHLRLLRTVPVEEAPDPEGTEAARAVTLILRDRLKRELGGLKSYEVLEKLLL